MKKLLSSAAVCGLAAFAVITPAHAASDGLSLDIGGYFKGYAMYTDQDDEDSDTESRNFDIIRDTEIHLGGETALDNGLTVGMHFEFEADGNGEDSMEVQESYAYFSGGWGRVNFGAEDGASYLLQVEAPSADGNLDGIRQFVNPWNHGGAETGGSLASLTPEGGDGLDYAQDVSGYADKFTYLSPVFNGFQGGLSYTPDISDDSDAEAHNFSDELDELGSVWELALRYEGQWNNVGVILGGGYTHADLEQEDDQDAAAATGFTDDREAWNLGADLDIGPFGIGVVYTEDNYGELDIDAVGTGIDTMDEEQTWVVGADYTTGPFKFGISYLNQDAANSITGDAPDADNGVEAERWAGGVVYTYGPGMTFRGSISHLELENVAGLAGTDDSTDATSVLFGTQINF